MDAQGIYDYVQSYEWRGDNGDYTPNDADREMLEDAIVGYLSSIEVGIPATGSPTRQEAATMVNELKTCAHCKGVAELDYEQPFCAFPSGKMEKQVAIYCTKCDVHMSMCYSDFPEYDHDEMASILTEKWNTRPSAPVEGLDTVGAVRQETIDGVALGQIGLIHQVGYDQQPIELVTRSQAAELLAAERAETMRQVKHWSELYKQQHYRAEKAEAIIAAERTESDEAYELGKRDGYSEAAQEIDLKTGGDGEYRYCTDHDPERHTPDPASMIQRIVERFETLNTMESVSEINEWKERAEKAEADNAALTARVKELEENKDVIAADKKTLLDLAATNGDKVTALETQLAALKDAAKSVEDWWLSEGMNHFPGAPYCIFAIRAALEDRP